MEFIPDIFHPNQRYCSTSCRNVPINKKRKEAKKEWAILNKEAVVKSKQKWLENNPDKRKESSKAYRKRNKEYYANYSSLRARHTKQSQPKWADVQDILDVYKEAAYFGLEVDHIIPIKHNLVCGLHVWSNLQLLSRADNAKKNNKFKILDEDVVGIIKDE